MRLYFTMFSFTAYAEFVIYGDESTPSHCVWMVPGTWEDTSDI